MLKERAHVGHSRSGQYKAELDAVIASGHLRQGAESSLASGVHLHEILRRAGRPDQGIQHRGGGAGAPAELRSEAGFDRTGGGFPVTQAAEAVLRRGRRRAASSDHNPFGAIRPAVHRQRRAGAAGTSRGQRRGYSGGAGNSGVHGSGQVRIRAGFSERAACDRRQRQEAVDGVGCGRGRGADCGGPG